MKKHFWFFGLFFVILLAACQPSMPMATSTPVPPVPTATEIPDPWQIVAEHTIKFSITLVGFDDPSFGLTLGEFTEAYYTHDAGHSWTHSENDATALYGLDIVDEQLAWSCGNPYTRISTDGGRSWNAVSDFGGGVPAHCRYISFLDEQEGWVATADKLGITNDGGTTWETPDLPEDINRIAAISILSPDKGYLLDGSGVLYATQDRAASWEKAAGPNLGDVEISIKNSPVAAMRFFDEQNGMIIISTIMDGTAQLFAFQTSDGGQSWSQETIANAFGHPYLSRDGRTLTIFTSPYYVTVFQYFGE